MKILRSHFHRIRLHFVALMVSVVISGGMAYGALHYKQMALTERNVAEASASDAETRAQTAVVDHANVETYRPVYLLLKQRQFIGDEQRLPWVEYFTRSALSGNPADLDFKIDPMRKLEDPSVTPEPLEGLQFNASKLALHSKILHELDALRLIGELKQMQGATILRRCNLKRMPDGAQKAPPYLLGFNCEGDLVTLGKAPVDASAGAAP